MAETQTNILMERFQANAFPTKEQMLQLAGSLNSTIKRINTWFKKMRRKNIAEGLLKRSEQYSVRFYECIIHVQSIDHLYLVYTITYMCTHICMHAHPNHSLLLICRCYCSYWPTKSFLCRPNIYQWKVRWGKIGCTAITACVWL